jgi:hypothetical protein
LFLNCGAAVANVADHHIGQGVEEILGTTGASDTDGGAVHVHFSVANFVEPSPRECVAARGEVLWNGEIINIGYRKFGITPWKISCLVFGRTATFNRLDHPPDGVLGGL